MIENILKIITPIITLVLGSGVTLYIVKNPEKLEKWGSIFMKFGRFFWKGKKRFERLYVSADMQGRLNTYLKDAQKITGKLPLKKVEIKWLKDENELRISREKFIKEGKLIIKLDESENQNENFLNAAMLMISECVVPNKRRYLTPSQKKSIDLHSCRKFFKSQKNELTAEFEDKFVSECNKNQAIAELIEKFLKIDEAGLFFPILIQELTFLQEKVIIINDLQIIYTEVNDFINFLISHIEKRKKGEEGELRFDGQFLRLNILIVGIQMKMHIQGIKPYVNRIKECKSFLIESIYVISPDKRTVINFVNNIIVSIGNNWNYINEFIYYSVNSRGKKIRNNLVILRNKDIKETITLNMSAGKVKNENLKVSEIKILESSKPQKVQNRKISNT